MNVVLMLDTKIPAENTPRSPLPAMIALLKQHERNDVKLLIARMLGTAVYNDDSEEVLYWAVIHHNVVGGDIDPDIRSELLAALGRDMTCFGGGK